ncbi:glycosyltransferase family 9 protein [Candidatus Woesearchaeota archaeon]|nr:glycosyltransferase family 9 protein [Candidatus Woesearchaeota archaeon]
MARIQWIIDKSAGFFICFILGGLSKFFSYKIKDIENPKNIAVIKLWALGESVLILPMIKSIKKRFPDSKITVIARKQNSAVFENLDFIDRIILFEFNNFFKILKLLRKFDLSIDCEPYLKLSGIVSWFCAKQRIGFSHTIRSWLYTHKVYFNDKQHEVLTFMNVAKKIGINYFPEKLEKLKYASDNNIKIDSILKKAGISSSDKIIGFCIGAAESSKQRMWPIENFAALADKLADNKNVKIIFVGAPSETSLIENARSKMKNHSLSFAGKTSIKDLFYLAERCSLFISNDTGPMHVAAAQGTKTIGLFGPNMSVRFGPFGKNNISIEKHLPCRPCINVHKGELPKCKQRKRLGEGYCMQLISVDDVFNKAVKML